MRALPLCLRRLFSFLQSRTSVNHELRRHPPVKRFGGKRCRAARARMARMPAAPADSPAPPAAETASDCFHCGLPLPPGTDFGAVIDGARRPMCCRGCEAVAKAIVDGGLGEYYRYRTQPAPTRRELVPAFLRETAVYDHPDVQKSFVRSEGEHVREAALILEC